MEEQNTNLKIDFSFTDEFGQDTRITKTFIEAVYIDRTQFEFLVEEFKLFLLAMGHSIETVDKVQIIYEN